MFCIDIWKIFHTSTILSNKNVFERQYICKAYNRIFIFIIQHGGWSFIVNYKITKRLIGRMVIHLIH